MKHLCSLYGHVPVFLPFRSFVPKTVITGIKKWDKRKQQEGEVLKNPNRTIAVIERLQTVTAPREFDTRGVYDGVVNFFTLKNMSQYKVLAIWLEEFLLSFRPRRSRSACPTVSSLISRSP